MIKSWKHKGLKQFFETGSAAGINPKHAAKLMRQLDRLDKMNKRKPTHPGTVVRLDVLEPLGLTVTQAAEGLDCSRKHLSAFLNGRARCTVELAVKLAKATGTSAQSWLNMQMTYDLWEAEQAQVGKTVKRFRKVA